MLTKGRIRLIVVREGKRERIGTKCEWEFGTEGRESRCLGYLASRHSLLIINFTSLYQLVWIYVVNQLKSSGIESETPISMSSSGT
jgi:hypothetical protein